ncbi:MAG: hypothetical protein HFH85_11035 [Lachnospiraceae bacterium]|nr:hypothetical protein [Lachnospiraceae bacterium]
MKVYLNKNNAVFLSIFVVTLSESLFIINRGLGGFFEYIGYGILLLSVLAEFCKKTNHKEFRRKVIVFILLSLLMSCGFLIQDLTIRRKFVLSFTVFAICIVSTLSEKYLNSFRLIRRASYAILYAVLAATILGTVGGEKIIGDSEGLFGFTFAFCGGIKFKNYFAADMLAVFMGIYFSYRYGEKRKIDKYLLYLSSFLIIISNSRGGWILFITFLIATRYSIIRKIKKGQRKLLIIVAGVIGIGIFIYFFRNIAYKSGTYMYRVRGLANYIQYYQNDIFHLFFGNAETVYDKTNTYVMTVRSIVGWDGSLEMAVLNILIKSGILGVIAYIIIYLRIGKNIITTNDWACKTGMVAVTVTMLISSLVEAYIQSVHCIFAIYGYMVISGLYDLSKRNEYQRINVDLIYNE